MYKSIILRHNYTLALEVLERQLGGSHAKSDKDHIPSIIVNEIEFKLESLVAISGDAYLQQFGFIKQIVSDGQRHSFAITMIETLYALPHMCCYVGKLSNNLGYKVIRWDKCSFPLVYKVEKDIVYMSAFGI